MIAHSQATGRLSKLGLGAFASAYSYLCYLGAACLRAACAYKWGLARGSPTERELSMFPHYCCHGCRACVVPHWCMPVCGFIACSRAMVWDGPFILIGTYSRRYRQVGDLSGGACCVLCTGCMWT